ncbi:hypothetical protein PTKIN_Ptkin03bG0026900 [Pterospermum kingtungense]
MFGHATFPRSSSELLSDSDPDVMSPLNFPLCPLTELAIPESFDSVSEALHSSAGGSSSGSYNSPSPLAGCCCCTQKQSLMQRSASTHSFQKNGLHCHFAEFIDSDCGSVRRVFSTGDLVQGQGQHHQRRRSESPSSNESNTNAIIEGMMTGACPYSPEEKKERIERYRSKRNLRNFNKKIKYACRKTLADSRPRIRGRFVRSEEIEKSPQVDQWNHIGGEEEEEDEDNWANFLDSLSQI